MEKFEQVYVEQILWAENTQAYALARLATSEGAASMENIAVTKLAIPSGNQPMINLCEVAMIRSALSIGR